MKIAIIGSGIAGNTLVWRMNAGHEVVVFEAGDHLGGHTHTHDVTVEGKTIQVDSGFIVFNEKTYPNFIDMLERLGVERQATEMSFSVHCERTGLEYAGTNLNSLFAQRKNLFSGKFYRLLMDIVRFNRRAPGFLNTEDTTTTLGEYLRDEGYSDNFLRYYILPMGAAIWSQDVESMLDFPARFFIRFFLQSRSVEYKRSSPVVCGKGRIKNLCGENLQSVRWRGQTAHAGDGCSPVCRSRRGGAPPWQGSV